MSDTHPRELHRLDADETSVAAAYSIDATKLETLVLNCIYSYGDKGCISDEVRSWFPDLAYSSITARYAKLLRTCQITRGPDCRAGDSGRQQGVMRARDQDKP